MILAVMVVNNFGRGRLLKFYSQRTAEPQQQVVMMQPVQPMQQPVMAQPVLTQQVGMVKPPNYTA